MLLGRPGNDTLDGGHGSNIVIDSFRANTVTSAAFADKDWLTDPSANVGPRWSSAAKVRTLPHAELSQLTRDLPRA